MRKIDFAGEGLAARGDRLAGTIAWEVTDDDPAALAETLRATLRYLLEIRYAGDLPESAPLRKQRPQRWAPIVLTLEWLEFHVATIPDEFSMLDELIEEFRGTYAALHDRLICWIKHPAFAANVLSDQTPFLMRYERGDFAPETLNAG